jgi:Xaa-Pro aminopeptidase
MDAQAAVTTSYDFLGRELEQLNADVYVHVGDKFDDSLRYLTRFDGPDREYAFVYTRQAAVLCPPRLFTEQATREFPGELIRSVEEQARDSAIERAIEVLEAETTGTRVAVPDTISQADYGRLLEAGYEPVETNCVPTARETKMEGELERLRTVQAVSQAGVARAEAVLGAAEVSHGEVYWNGDPLTTERLRREINTVLVANGINDAGNTVIGAGPTCADLHFTGTDTIAPGEAVLIDVSPRGPEGYYGDCTRTFVVGEPTDWVRDTYETVRNAQDIVLSELERGAGTVPNAVQEAVRSHFERDGFEAGYGKDRGFYHGTGHGVGLTLHEEPTFSSTEPFAAGNVVTVEPGVYDPATGGVRIEDLVVVTDQGFENLTSYPRSYVPDPERDPGRFLERAGSDCR